MIVSEGRVVAAGRSLGLLVALLGTRVLESFLFGVRELDPATQRQLDRGLRMVELLKQDQYAPYPYHRQIVSIYAGTQGLLDDLPATSAPSAPATDAPAAPAAPAAPSVPVQ